MTVTQPLVNGLARFRLHLGASSVPIRLLAIVCLWLGGQPILSLSMGAVSAQDRSVAIARVTTGKIHLIMVADTDDNRIGQSVATDLRRVTELFADHVPKHQLRVTTLSGREVRRRNMLNSIGALRINPDLDTVVFYFSGHGGYDQNAKDHVLYGLGQQEGCFRSEIRAAIQQFRPRLTVIIADTCSETQRSPITAAPGLPRAILTPIFRALFMEPVGLVDISSTLPGQVADGDYNGGWFTTNFCSCLDRNRETRLSWAAVLEDVSQHLKTEHPLATQTAYAISLLPPLPRSPLTLPAGQAINRTRFGAYVTDSRSGVQVTGVMPNSPATRCQNGDGKNWYLEADDVITHVNGRAVQTEAEYRAAVLASPSLLRITVIGGKDNQRYEFTAQLDDTATTQPVINAGQPANRTRFGAYIQNSRSGVQVTGVMANSPATRCQNGDGKNWYLEAGDVITHVNGQPVQSEAEYRAAILESPSTMKISVIGGKDRQRYEFSAQLND